jgi:hypothetical protein
MGTQGITLNRHILDEEHKHPGAGGELSRLLVQVPWLPRQGLPVTVPKLRHFRLGQRFLSYGH